MGDTAIKDPLRVVRSAESWSVGQLSGALIKLIAFQKLAFTVTHGRARFKANSGMNLMAVCKINQFTK